MNELALELGTRGHVVSVIAGLTGNGWLGIRGRLLLKMRAGAAVRDRSVGYDVYRAWFPEEAVAEVTARFAPDVAVVHSGAPVIMSNALRSCRVPTVGYLRNVEVDRSDGDPSQLRDLALISNSQFTADWYAARYALRSEVVHPLFQAERYRTKSAQTHVVFINPHPLKGRDTAIAIAQACPEIPFLFVEAWTLGMADREALARQIDQLHNVTLLPRTNDMRQIYRRARVVLVPSQWEEAFGRVVAEAQFSGIPAITSAIGGLPEAVGTGGILVPADAPIETWIDSVRSVWFDDELRERLATAARAHASRPGLDRDHQLDRIVAILENSALAASADGQLART